MIQLRVIAKFVDEVIEGASLVHLIIDGLVAAHNTIISAIKLKGSRIDSVIAHIHEEVAQRHATPG